VQNFHPLFTHFPIALLLVSVAAAVVAHVKGSPGAHLVARVLLYLGTAAAAVTALTGFLAEQTVTPVAGAHAVIEEHQTYAYILLGIAALLSAWSLLSWRRRRLPPRPAALWLIGHAALVAFVFLTAKEGGELVHELGVGTKMTAKGGPLYDPRAASAQPAADSTAPRPTGRDFK
jgi:LPXTG-motif cell wall-anchored protein